MGSEGWAFCVPEGSDDRPRQDEGGYDDRYEDDLDCWNCGGEGFVFSCFDGFCADSDEGCDDCTRPCPICCPRKPQSADSKALAQILADALAKATGQPITFVPTPEPDAARATPDASLQGKQE